MSTRREFIKQSSLIAAGAVISGNAFGLNFIKKPRVIILGAGLSGLAAGKMLTENGYDITILEARNRISGRVFSHIIDEKEDLVIEFGGEWIGDSHKRMLAICDQLGLELLDNRFHDRLIYDNKYTESEESVFSPEWFFSPEWKEKYKKILDGYSNLSEKDLLELDKMDWWRYLMNQGISQKDLDIMEYANSTDFGESIRFVSAYSALYEYANSNATNELDKKVKGGNGRIAKAMADKIGWDKIKTDHRVESVSYNGLNSGITVICKNGESFECDKLICSIPTFSISKIKWNPVLPKSKTDAINALQYSRINKSATLFNEKFWESSGKGEKYSILTDTFAHYFYTGTKNQPSSKGVLISYSIGDKADIFHHMTQAERERTITQSLSAAFGDVSNLIDKNMNYYWGADEYSMGAYGFYGKGQAWIMPVLQEKLGNIYFSGEHISDDWQGFMEGAVQTGEIAATGVMS
ncbi:MAG TPA: NAD(P)/FAD-dependent oxidoreductase [Ignavibacteria bacterium]|nr:NAD(P)/FAD-dependent oxidoreductase [Ignavibacteria bacterium]